MQRPVRGHSIPLSVGRKLVLEILHHARQVPSLPLARDCDLAPLARARQKVEAPPSWMALFIRAYGLLSQRVPELRQAYLPWPWPRLYQHPFSNCVVLVERDWQGQPTVLCGKIHAPECSSVAQIDEHLRRFKQDEVWSISPFRQFLRLGQLPWLLRRLAFSSSLYFSGSKRAKRFGTFTISSLGNLGAEQIHPLSPLTTYFTFGPITAEGGVTLKIVYDHRVMDGRCVARALAELEAILCSAVLDEISARRRAA